MCVVPPLLNRLGTPFAEAKVVASNHKHDLPDSSAGSGAELQGVCFPQLRRQRAEKAVATVTWIPSLKTLNRLCSPRELG